MNERNHSDDYATGVNETDLHEAVQDAVDQFNLWANARGFDADVRWFRWGEYVITVSIDSHRIATASDLDAFEALSRQVDEGAFEFIPFEAAA